MNAHEALQRISYDDLNAKMKLLSEKIKTSAGQYTINREGLSTLDLPIPPIHLQIVFFWLKDTEPFNENLFILIMDL